MLGEPLAGATHTATNVVNDASGSNFGKVRKLIGQFYLSYLGGFVLFPISMMNMGPPEQPIE
jgi:hypothetical protein